ncbi:hypothetical protein F5882DRAFT_305766, partial [Hyaloscypha sp. PMI_1271]
DSYKKIIETLELNSKVLDNINEEFKSKVRDYSIKIYLFQEARGISKNYSLKLDIDSLIEIVESIDMNYI